MIFNEKIPVSWGVLHINFPFKCSRVLLKGDNGAGKTTFFQYLKVHKKRLFSNSSVGILDQAPMRVLGNLCARDLIELLEEEYPGSLANKKELWETFSPEPLMDQPFRKLSGGENQWMKLFCLFYLKKDYYLLDEPTNNLSEERKIILTQWLKKCSGKILLIAHDPSLGEIMDECYKFTREGVQCLTQ